MWHNSNEVPFKEIKPRKKCTNIKYAFCIDTSIYSTSMKQSAGSYINKKFYSLHCFMNVKYRNSQFFLDLSFLFLI